MEMSESNSSVTVGENGLNHYRMDADTGNLGVTGNALGEEIPEPFVPTELAEGVYANLAYIRTAPDEIVLDFARMNPSSNIPTVKARIVMTTGAAIELAKAIQDKIK